MVCRLEELRELLCDLTLMNKDVKETVTQALGAENVITGYVEANAELKLLREELEDCVEKKGFLVFLTFFDLPNYGIKESKSTPGQTCSWGLFPCWNHSRLQHPFLKKFLLGRPRLYVESALWSHICVVVVEDPPPPAG